MECVRSVVEAVPFDYAVLAIGLLYAAYFVCAICGVVFMTTNDAQWAVDFSVYTILVTSGLHFALTGVGFALYRDYQPHPVGPEWLFYVADLAQAAALGAVAATFSLDPTNRSAPYAASGITIAAQFLCFYKTRRLLQQAANGTRDSFGVLRGSDDAW